MPFTTKDWKNSPDATTPISAEALEDLEARVAAYADAQVATRVAEATRTASGKGFVNHGATAGTARPTGYASVEWVGSVSPTNAVDGDTWVNTT